MNLFRENQPLNHAPIGCRPKSSSCPEPAGTVAGPLPTGRVIRSLMLPALLALAWFSPAWGKSAPDGAICPLLDEVEVTYLLPAAAGAQVRTRDKPWPSCTFTWTAALPIRKTIGGQVMEIPGEGRLTITVVAVQDPDADWERVLNKYRGEDPVGVPAVGRRAVWSVQRRQLSIQAERHLYHVALENPDEPSAEQETAVRFGLLLVDQHQ